MAHRLTGLHVVAPSIVTVGEPFSLGVKVLTDPYVAPAGCFGPMFGAAGRYNISPRGIRYMDNVLPEWQGVLEVETDDGYAGPRSLSFADTPPRLPHDRRPIRRFEGLSFSTPGRKVIRLRDPESGQVGASNPIEVSAAAPSERLFWMDPHSQTFFSDGLRCPEELYTFARDEAFLDAFAISDHAEWLTDRQWEYFVAVTNDFNEPGRFATLQGLEWTSFRFGNRNVYFPGPEAPIWRSDDPVMGELSNLYRAAREHGAIVVPHHTATAQIGVDWSLGHDPQVERLVEIHSVWGTSERSVKAGNSFPIWGGEAAGRTVIDALQRGYRFGFLGGGDIHDGRPGDELHHLQDEPDGYRELHRQGITGIWATALTREAVFDAMWNRRVYATTNARILLRFTVDGQPMGSQLPPAGPVAIHAHAMGTAPIARADLVHNGADVQTIEPQSDVLDWETTVTAPAPGYLYVRIAQADGQMAWSSPVWLEGN